MKTGMLILLLCQFFSLHTGAQAIESTYIYSKEGRPMLNRMGLMASCLEGMKKDKSDGVAVAICDCELDKINGYFSNKDFKKATVKGRVIDVSAMISKDSFIMQQITECYTRSGRAELIHAEANEEQYIISCINGLKKSSKKNLDSSKLVSFCTCRLSLLKSKRMTDNQLKALQDPNSVLFYEMMYSCGNPFSVTDDERLNWKASLSKDILGPSVDTLSFVSINGMTYLKAKTGSLVQFWLFDSGASDLLIGKETEEKLKAENYIKQENYLGSAEYEMANGSIDTCRKYRIDNFRIGKFTINNIVVAVSDKANRVIIGRSLLNKFSSWILDNKREVLILKREE